MCLQITEPAAFFLFSFLFLFFVCVVFEGRSVGRTGMGCVWRVGVGDIDTSCMTDVCLWI